MKLQELKLPKDTHWIIVAKENDLYALDAPTVGWSKDEKVREGQWSITRFMDDKTMEEITSFLVWIANDCPVDD